MKITVKKTTLLLTIPLAFFEKKGNIVVGCVQKRRQAMQRLILRQEYVLLYDACVWKQTGSKRTHSSNKKTARNENHMGMMSEFRECAVKGNAMDMAVGIIIGGAFVRQPLRPCFS